MDKKEFEKLLGRELLPHCYEHVVEPITKNLQKYESEREWFYDNNEEIRHMILCYEVGWYFAEYTKYKSDAQHWRDAYYELLEKYNELLEYKHIGEDGGKED